ncbi:hypothetical protein KAI32_00310 [Candidatus Pacearchaeota archaeon]|nr:hypothetical protein [Candidatus Pacearchaeota archaeon]
MANILYIAKNNEVSNILNRKLEKENNFKWATNIENAYDTYRVHKPLIETIITDLPMEPSYFNLVNNGEKLLEISTPRGLYSGWAFLYANDLLSEKYWNNDSKIKQIHIFSSFTSDLKDALNKRQLGHSDDEYKYIDSLRKDKKLCLFYSLDTNRFIETLNL